jgi:hypothetical protein
MKQVLSRKFLLSLRSGQNEDWHEVALQCMLSFPLTFSLLTGPVTLALWVGLSRHCPLGYGLAYFLPTYHSALAL